MSPFQKYPHLFHSLSPEEQRFVAALGGSIMAGNKLVLMKLAVFLERILAASIGIDFTSLEESERVERCLEYLMVGLRLRVCTAADVTEIVLASQNNNITRYA